MINQIADKIAEQLKANVAFADVCVGLVKTVDTMRNGKQQKFPVAYNTSPTQLVSGDYIDLIPNDKYKSIMYFDSGSASVVRFHNRWNEYEGTLKLVVWINYDLINASLVTPLHEDSYLVAEVIKNIPEKLCSFKCINGLAAFFTSQDIKDGAVFSRFTYDEKQQQYWTYPFDYFSINLNVLFRMNVDCFDFSAL